LSDRHASRLRAAANIDQASARGECRSDWPAEIQRRKCSARNRNSAEKPTCASDGISGLSARSGRDNRKRGVERNNTAGIKRFIGRRGSVSRDRRIIDISARGFARRNRRTKQRFRRTWLPLPARRQRSRDFLQRAAVRANPSAHPAPTDAERDIASVRSPAGRKSRASSWNFDLALVHRAAIRQSRAHARPAKFRRACKLRTYPRRAIVHFPAV